MSVGSMVGRLGWSGRSGLIQRRPTEEYQPSSSIGLSLPLSADAR